MIEENPELLNDDMNISLDPPKKTSSPLFPSMKYANEIGDEDYKPTPIKVKEENAPAIETRNKKRERDLNQSIQDSAKLKCKKSEDLNDQATLLYEVWGSRYFDPTTSRKLMRNHPGHKIPSLRSHEEIGTHLVPLINTADYKILQATRKQINRSRLNTVLALIYERMNPVRLRNCRVLNQSDSASANAYQSHPSLNVSRFIVTESDSYEVSVVDVVQAVDPNSYETSWKSEMYNIAKCQYPYHMSKVDPKFYRPHPDLSNTKINPNCGKLLQCSKLERHYYADPAQEIRFKDVVLSQRLGNFICYLDFDLNTPEEDKAAFKEFRMRPVKEEIWDKCTRTEVIHKSTKLSLHHKDGMEIRKTTFQFALRGCYARIDSYGEFYQEERWFLTNRETLGPRTFTFVIHQYGKSTDFHRNTRHIHRTFQQIMCDPYPQDVYEYNKYTEGFLPMVDTIDKIPPRLRALYENSLKQSNPIDTYFKPLGESHTKLDSKTFRPVMKDPRSETLAREYSTYGEELLLWIEDVASENDDANAYSSLVLGL